MSVPVWASDTDYSPPASVSPSQATKVMPSAGAIAQGLIPGAYNAAQRLNWLLNALCTLANTNESDVATNTADIATNTADIASNLAAILSNDSDIAALQALLDARSLQAAYDRSVALGQTSPMINVDSGFLIGTTAVPSIFLIDPLDGYPTVNHLAAGSATVTGAINANGALNVDLADVTFGDGSSGQHAVIHTGGAAGELALASGTWTPAASAATGSGASTGQLTGGRGRYHRIGDQVFFTAYFAISVTGWGGGGPWTFDIPLPVTTTANVMESVVNPRVQGALAGRDIHCDAIITGHMRVNIGATGSSPPSAFELEISGAFPVA